MSRFARFVIAGFVCIYASVFTFPVLAQCGNTGTECGLQITTCPSEPLQADANCRVTIPAYAIGTGPGDVGVMPGVFCGPNGGPITLTQDPPALTLIDAGNLGFVEVCFMVEQCYDFARGEQVPFCDRNSLLCTIPVRPYVACPTSPQTLPADDSCQAIVPDLTPEVSCLSPGDGTEIVITQTPEPGSPIPLGQTDVTILVERCFRSPGPQLGLQGGGECELLGSCTVLLDVIDQTPPIIVNCPEDLTIGADADCLGTVPELTVPSVEGLVIATDNCTDAAGIGITQDPPAGTPIELGTTVITITATDAAGNGASCTVTLQLEENGCMTPEEPEPQPAPCPPDAGALNLLYSLLFHTPVCGMGCPLMLVATLCGMVMLKFNRRRRR